MKKKLGIEIELTGVTRSEVVVALENLFQSKAASVKSESAEDGYCYHKIADMYGNNWRVMRDRSISPQIYDYKRTEVSSDDRFKIVDLTADDTTYMVEVVSPVLTSETLPILFSVVDVVKSLGGIVNSSCGIHVHIDKPDNVDNLVGLFKKFCLEQDAIFSAFDVNKNREEKYCKKYDMSLLSSEFATEEDFLEVLYETYAQYEGDKRIDRTLRYHALNFHSIRTHGTVEFRLFNSSLDRAKIAKIINWVLNFVYALDDYNDYIPVLGSILMTELNNSAV